MRRGRADLIGGGILMGLHRPGRGALLRFSWAGQSRKGGEVSPYDDRGGSFQDGQFELAYFLKLENNLQNMIQGCGCLAFITNCKYKNSNH